jgi:hypothetical protein
MESLLEPWPWYVSGPLLGLVVPLLFLLGSSFGVSGNLDSLCSLLGASKWSDHFDFNLKDRVPSLTFLLGSIVGGFITYRFLSFADHHISLSVAAKNSISDLGIDPEGGMLPTEIFNWEFAASCKGIIILVLGGFLIGFGTRYAGGCTSGHSITGISTFQLPSLVATIGFFIGGLISTFLLLPIILK